MPLRTAWGGLKRNEMDEDHALTVLLAKLRALEIRVRLLQDRVDVIFANTIDHESRLQQLEEKIEEKL